MCKCNNEDCEYKEGELYWHEALDRSHVACDHFYEYVQQHPAVQHDKELEEAATAVTDAMADFYQLVGRKSCEFDRRRRSEEAELRLSAIKSILEKHRGAKDEPYLIPGGAKEVLKLLFRDIERILED
jgi:hypothetical protein